MNIFVAKLSSSTTDEDLRNLFSEFGEVTKASVILDRDTGEPRGFGFVDMPDAENARNAIKTLDGASINGRNIVVKEADDRRNTGAPSGGGGYRDSGSRQGGEGGSREGGFRPGTDRNSSRPGADNRNSREGGFRPGGDRGGAREGGFRPGGDRDNGRDGGFRPGADRAPERGGERGSERGGFPPPLTPDSDGEFRKPARTGNRGKDLDRKKNDWERRGTPKKSAIPPKKGPKKGRSFEDFDDDL